MSYIILISRSKNKVGVWHFPLHSSGRVACSMAAKMQKETYWLHIISRQVFRLEYRGFPRKRYYLLTKVHGVTSQKIVVYTFYV